MLESWIACITGCLCFGCVYNWLPVLALPVQPQQSVIQAIRPSKGNQLYKQPKHRQPVIQEAQAQETSYTGNASTGNQLYTQRQHRQPVSYTGSWCNYACFLAPLWLSWSSRGTSRALLELSWGPLGLSCGYLGLSRSSLGALLSSLGALRALLGLSWAAPGAALGSLGALLGHSWAVLRLSWSPGCPKSVLGSF